MQNSIPTLAGKDMDMVLLFLEDIRDAKENPLHSYVFFGPSHTSQIPSLYIKIWHLQMSWQ
jgi:hypothetical protein